MDALTFRRDPYLRSSAYHLATWSLTAFVLVLRAQSSEFGVDLVPMTVMLVGAAAMTSMTHERRVGKMVGPAGEAVWPEAGAMWLRLLGALVINSGWLMGLGRPDLLFTLWALGVGAGLAVWGRRVQLDWYLGAGATLAAVGVLDALLTVQGAATLGLRLVVLGLAVPAFALATNQRFLWFRPGRR